MALSLPPSQPKHNALLYFTGKLSAGFGEPFSNKGEPARGSCREKPARGPEQPLRSSRKTQSRVQGAGESGSQGRQGDIIPAGLAAAASLRRPAAHAGVWGGPMARRDARLGTSPPEESSAARVRQTLAAAPDRARGRVRPLVFSY